MNTQTTQINEMAMAMILNQMAELINRNKQLEQYIAETKVPFQRFNVVTKKFEYTFGKMVIIEGYKCFVYKGDYDCYYLIEASGFIISTLCDTEDEAINKAKIAFMENKEGIEKMLERAIKRYGRADN